MEQVRVLIVDDQPLVRQGLLAVLQDQNAIRIVGEASNGADAVRLAARLMPDVVLMDLNMPGMGGLDATRQLCATHPGMRVIVLTVYDEDDALFEALRSGASGFILKDAPTAKLVEAVREVAAGRALLSPQITAALIQEFVRRPAMSKSSATQSVGLTQREGNVLELLVQGLSNEEIAQRLVLGESTIKSHVQNLYRKIGVRDRSQVIIYAYENGLVRHHPLHG